MIRVWIVMVSFEPIVMVHGLIWICIKSIGWNAYLACMVDRFYKIKKVGGERGGGEVESR